MSPENDIYNLPETLERLPFILAPMAGITTSAFRKICRDHGASLSFTELVSVEGIHRQSEPTMRYLETIPGEKPVGAHLFGSSPDSFARAARVVSQLNRFALIDINCGCPVRKVTRRGGGAALINSPEKIGEIIRATKEAGGLPVTIKTRIGITPGKPELERILEMANHSGATAVFVHGRYASVRHGGPANLELISLVARHSSIPVFANGGIIKPPQAQSALSLPGISGIMIGRGAIGKPWIFSQCARLLKGKKISPPAPLEILAIIQQHLELEAAQTRKNALSRGLDPKRGETIACRAFLPHLIGYLRGFPQARQARVRYFEEVFTIANVLERAQQILLN